MWINLSVNLEQETAEPFSLGPQNDGLSQDTRTHVTHTRDGHT